MSNARITLFTAALGMVAALSLSPGRSLAQEERKGDAAQGREGRTLTCAVSLAKMPDTDTLSSLQKVFGPQLKIAVDKDLKVVILQGPERAVAGAVQGLREVIDPVALAQREEGPRQGRSIEVVRLRKTKSDMVAKVIKQYVSDKLEITERPAIPALIIEGDGPVVAQATLLARQLDGQMLHPSLRRMLQPERRDGDRPRGDGDRPKEEAKPRPKGDGKEEGKPQPINR
jgi:hypothetical protein